MNVLPSEVVLTVVERMDTASTAKLMETNKWLNAVIRSHQRSICKARMAAFTLPPTGDVLSSEDYYRQRLPHGTFSMIRELEKREAQCDEVVQSSKFINTAWPPGMGFLTDIQQERLRALLKQALMRCNQIADIAANAPCSPLSLCYYSFVETGEFEDPDLPSPDRQLDPITNFAARDHQLEYIESLPLEDLAILYYTINAMGLGYLSKYGEGIVSEPSLFERTTVFEECLLRHGTWFAWSAICGEGIWTEMAEKIQNIGWTELNMFEDGVEGTKPTLKSMVLRQFKRLAKPDDEDNDTWHDLMIHRLFNMIKDLVVGPDEKKEAAEAAAEAAAVEGGADE
ncbi:hypothetical protein AAE478_002145 [Parahypoxylon ruwenzoriense]